MAPEGSAGGSDEARGAASVDPAEVARFSALSGGWWDPDGPFRPLHRLTPARMAFVREALAPLVRPGAPPDRPFAGLSVLDIGCGGGLLSEPMARLGARVAGIDPSEGAVAAARAHADAAGLGIDYRRGAVEDAGGPDGPFDAAIASEVVEHTADPAAFLAAVAGRLAPGGVVVLTTINRTARSLAVAKVLAEYVLRAIPAGTHDWRKFPTPRELRGMLARAGLRVTAERGIVYDIPRDRFALGRDMSVNYAMAATRAVPAEEAPRTRSGP